MMVSCNNSNSDKAPQNDTLTAKGVAVGYDSTFKVEAEAFADLQMLRYEIPGFNELSLKQKQLSYYLLRLLCVAAISSTIRKAKTACCSAKQ